MPIEMESVTIWLFTRLFEPLTGSMTAFCWVVGWILFKRRIFIKI
jgi:hypothetical protein